MKKNIQINLFGTLYNIDEDAYQLLEKYIDSMKRYFAQQEGGEEISDDIEHRVAELLWEKKTTEGIDAVNIEMVKEIMGKIGKAEEIGDIPSGESTESGDASSSSSSSSSSDSTSDSEHNRDRTNYDPENPSAGERIRSHFADRRLFRDSHDKVIGGVCSGMAKYFDFGEPWMWRLGLVLLFLCKGVGLLVYLILWLVIPEARTPEDFLKMEGKPLNPENLNEQILKDSNRPTQSPNNGNGCLKAIFFFLLLGPLCFILLFLLLSVPVIFGVFSGLTGTLFSLPGTLLGAAVEASSFSLWSGLACVVIILLTLIILLIRAFRGGSKRLSSGAIIAIILLLLGCLIWGSYAITNAVVRIVNSVDKGGNNTSWNLTVEDDPDEASQKMWDEQYLDETGFSIVSNNCYRSTYSSEYYTGDDSDDKRYLDAYDGDRNLTYTAQKADTLEAGTYTLTAMVRAEDEGARIFACVGFPIEEANVEGNTVHFIKITPYGNQGGQLLELAKHESTWNDVLKYYPELADEKENILQANWENGFGWSMKKIENLVVPSRQVVYYGVTTDWTKTLEKPNCLWFSACDFKLYKEK